MITEARILDSEMTNIEAIIDGLVCSGIRCRAENGQVIVDGGNEMANRVRDWIAAGNSVTPYAAPQPTEADYQTAIQTLIDRTAQSRQYADGIALAGYINSTVPIWASEATAFIAWRDSVWLYAYGELAKVQAGQRSQPDVATLISELPTIAWPI